MSSVSALQTVQKTMDMAVKEAGRSTGSVQLIAVSKNFAPESIKPVLRAGQRIFGENRIQEAEQKWPALREEFADIILHLIGPLQSNKTKNAVAFFDMIQSVDRPKIAATIAREAEKQGRCPQLMIQVNTGEEPQKAGILPGESDDFIREIRENMGLPLCGLMCIPPLEDPPALHFALLRQIARRNDIVELSMGMSGDYETAIHFGASYVRVGSAIFGTRKQ